jgi:cell division septal protein FtsQ
MLVFSPFFKVDLIEIKGVKRLSPVDINLVLGIKDDSILAVDPDTTVKNLQNAFPDIEQAKVQLILPATVRIQATERIPVLRWINDSGEHWVDQSGVIFPARGDGSGLPLVQADILPGVTEDMLAILAGVRTTAPDENGKIYPVSLDPKLVKALISLSKNVPQGQVLIYQEDHGFGWTDAHGWAV